LDDLLPPFAVLGTHVNPQTHWGGCEQNYLHPNLRHSLSIQGSRTTTAAPLPCRIFSVIFLGLPLEIYHLAALRIACVNFRSHCELRSL